MKQPKAKTKDYDTTATEVAGIFGCTNRYVRAIIADAAKKKYKGDKPTAIRSCYYRLKQGKSKLIQKENTTMAQLKNAS